MATNKGEGSGIQAGMQALRDSAGCQDLTYEGVLNACVEEAIVQFYHSHEVPRVPPEAIEKVRVLLGETGPPKWYLDVFRYRWDR